MRALSNLGRRERGLAMFDVLVAMTIFSLLTIIAISATGQYRERVWEASAMSDARNVGRGLVSNVAAAPIKTSSGDMVLAAVTSPPRLIVHRVMDPVAATGQRLSSGNRLVDWTPIGKHDFAFCVEHVEQGAVRAFAAYRSDRGGIYAHGRFDGCPEVKVDDVDDENNGPDPDPDPTDALPTPAPTTPPAPGDDEDVTPEPAPWLISPPTSAADIEELCSRDWGPRMIYGNGAVVYGTAGHDVIFAGNGGQTVYGRGGDDLICGGNGKDILYGGEGSDILYGGNGKDILYGGPGRDYLHGNNGKDTLYVGDGFADVAFGGNGTDIYLEDGPSDPTDEDEFVQGGPNG